MIPMEYDLLNEGFTQIRKVVETVRIDGLFGSKNVEQYLSSKPETWKLWEWKWTNVEPKNAGREWNAVTVTWEPRR